MKEDFPSFREIWIKRKDPVLVGKFNMLFYGISSVLILVTFLNHQNSNWIWFLRGAFVIYLLASILTIYLLCLCETKWWQLLLQVLLKLCFVVFFFFALRPF